MVRTCTIISAMMSPMFDIHPVMITLYRLIVRYASNRCLLVCAMVMKAVHTNTSQISPITQRIQRMTNTQTWSANFCLAPNGSQDTLYKVWQTHWAAYEKRLVLPTLAHTMPRSANGSAWPTQLFLLQTARNDGVRLSQDLIIAADI